MKHFLIAFSVLILCADDSKAQKKELSLSDAVMKSWSNLAPERVKKLQWLPKTSTYIYGGVKDSQAVFFKDNAISDQKQVWFTLSDFNMMIKGDGDSLKSLPQLNFIDSSRSYFKIDSTYKFIDHYTKNRLNSIVLPGEADNVDVHGKTYAIAYTIENNLFLKKPDNITIKISDEQRDGLVFGQAVHRFEFGISKGTFWSPDGNYLAFYKMDESMVTDYPLVDISPKPARLKSVKYPMSGETSHQVRLGVFNVKSTTITYLDVAGPEDQYLTNISWSPDEKYIYIVN